MEFYNNRFDNIQHIFTWLDDFIQLLQTNTPTHNLAKQLIKVGNDSIKNLYHTAPEITPILINNMLRLIHKTLSQYHNLFHDQQILQLYEKHRNLIKQLNLTYRSEN
jgi:hypothetical protein